MQRPASEFRSCSAWHPGGHRGIVAPTKQGTSRSAHRLGCSQSAILQAAGIDISVVAALPEVRESFV